jgi:outer membrane protein OmpA-like peptidoglycan-associated protein
VKASTARNGPAPQAGVSRGRGRDESPHAPRSGIPRFLPPLIVTDWLAVSRPDDRSEREADRIAERFHKSAPSPASPATPASLSAFRRSSIAAATSSHGEPLDARTRTHMEHRFGVALGEVRVHTGSQAERLNRDLGAHAFSQGRDIFFGEGHCPGADALTAHEIAHVVQQGGGSPHSAFGTISAANGNAEIHCARKDFSGSYPAGDNGYFEIDLRTVEKTGKGGYLGMDGYIRFVPIASTPDSNNIWMIQTLRITDDQGIDQLPDSVGPEQAQRGELGEPGLYTKRDPHRDIQGGFGIDAGHKGRAAGSGLSPRYDSQPAPPGMKGIGDVQQPPKYGGGIGGVVDLRPGFKRSGAEADIRSVAIYDRPGMEYGRQNVRFDLETVPFAVDRQFAYAAVTWGFHLEDGAVEAQHLDVRAGPSPTFDEALERHRDFYLFHEYLSFYFAPGSAFLRPEEAQKIESFSDFLRRNPRIRLALTGYADITGGESLRNLELSLERAEAVRAALVGSGIDPSRIDDISVGRGASQRATRGSPPGDQGGDEAVGRDPTREANLRPNRRVMVNFYLPPGAP